MHSSRLRSLLLPLAFFAVLASCDVFSSDKEPNSTPQATSTTLVSGETLNGRFKRSTSLSTVDTVKLTFSADSGKTYGLTLNSEKASIYSSSSWILTPGGARLDPSHSSASVADDSLTFYCTKTGTYTLVFYGYTSGADWAVKMTSKPGLPSGVLGGDAYEFDDSRKLAKAIATDSSVQKHTISGYFSDADDIDWIAIQCDSGKTYTVHYTYSDVSSFYSLNLYFFDTDSNSLTSSESGSTDSDIHYRSYEISKKGTYYIRATANYAMEYTVAVTAKDGISIASVPDAFENDNTLKTAKTIKTDSSWQQRSTVSNAMWTTSYDDIDWIAIKCDSGKTYTVHYDNNSVYMGLYNSDSASLTYTTSNQSVNGKYVYRSTFEVYKAGTYYVRFYAYDNFAYDIAVTAKDGINAASVPDAFENDNTIKTAKAIKTDSTWQDRSLASNLSSTYSDVDFVAIKCDSGMTYTLLYRYGSSSSSLYMDLFDSDSAYMTYTTSSQSVNDEYVYKRTFEVIKAGTYYARLYGSSKVAYKVAVTAKQGIDAASVPDEFESDNTLKTAKSIKTDSTWQQHSLASSVSSSYSDIDFVAIKCDSGKTYTLLYQNSNSSSSSSLYMGLFDSDSATMASTSSSQTVDGKYVYKRTFEVGKAGTYYARFYGTGKLAYKVAVTAKQGISASSVIDSYESDNTLATAKTIAADSVWQSRSLHMLGGYPNADLIAFKVDSGKTYRFQMTGASSNTYMAALDGDSSLVTYQDSTAGSRQLLLIPVIKSGTCYVRVYSTSSYPTAYKVALTSSAGLPSWGLPESGEPDHGMSSAAAIATDSTLLYRTIAGNDTDWIKIPVSKNHIYSIQFANRATSSADNSTLYSRLSTSDGSSIYSDNYVNGYESWSTTYESPFDGAIYLKVQHSYSYTSSVPYSVRVSSRAIPFDAMEPDSNMSSASKLASDTAAVQRGVRSVDEDWMQIQVETGRRFTIYVTKPTYTNYIYYQLYSRDSVFVQSGSLSSASTGSMSYTPRYTGPMYIRVYSTTTENIDYGIRVENYPKDVTEPDNDMASAILIKPDGSVSASLLSETDEDWVKFPAKAGTTYRVSWYSDNYISTYLFDSDSTRINYSSSDDSGSIFQKTTADDTLYVRTLAYSSSTTTPFAVRIAVTPVANDSDDPANDNLGGARLLTTDSSVQRGRIILDDKDHFFFNADSGTTYVFSTSYSWSLSCKILNADSTVLLSNSSTSSFSWTAPKSGKFFMCVTGYNSYYVNDYSLAVKAHKPDTYENDNNQSSAKPIATDGTPQSRSLLGADEDWMSVAVDSGVLYTLHYTGNNTAYNVIYTDDSLTLYSSSIIYSGGTRSFSSRRKCNVFVKLSPYTTASVTNYQIWITKPED